VRWSELRNYDQKRQILPKVAALGLLKVIFHDFPLKSHDQERPLVKPDHLDF